MVDDFCRAPCETVIPTGLRPGLGWRIAAELSGSHRSNRIASDLASRALASQAKPQRESESQALRITRS